MSNLLTTGILQQIKNNVKVYLIDLYPTAKFAYSLRKLKSTVTNVIEVRRSGDDALSDFTETQILDGTLTAWVIAGGGTQMGYVRSWYDQTGNGFTLGQTVNALQPVIVDSGVLVTDGAKPAVYFNTSSYMKTTVATVFSQPNHNFVVTDIIVEGYIYAGKSDRNDYYTLGRNYAGLTLTSSRVRTGKHIDNSLFNGASSVIRQDGAQVGFGNVGTQGLSELHFNTRASNITGNAEQYLQEFISWDDRTADELVIEADMNAYYVVY